MKFEYSVLSAGCIALALSGCVNAAKSITRAAPTKTATGQMSVSSCSTLRNLEAAHDAPVRGDAFNNMLFDEAVLSFTNQERCAGGLNPLSADAGLRSAAQGHSADMARMNFFAHGSPVPGKAKFTDRMRNAGASFTAAAENLGQSSILSFDSGRQFFVIDRSACQFSYQQGGAPVPPHSYRSLAQTIVRSWKNSPEHRQNLMGSQYTRLGTGGAISPNAQNCGDIVATQNFAA